MAKAYPSPFDLPEDPNLPADPNMVAPGGNPPMDPEGNAAIFAEEVPPEPEMPPAEAVLPPQVPPGPVPAPEDGEYVVPHMSPANPVVGPPASPMAPPAPRGMADDEMLQAMRAGMGR